MGRNSMLTARFQQLQQSREYQALMAEVALACRNKGVEPLASVADNILRPIARDLSAQSGTGRIVIHLNVVG